MCISLLQHFMSHTASLRHKTVITQHNYPDIFFQTTITNYYNLDTNNMPVFTEVISIFLKAVSSWFPSVLRYNTGTCDWICCCWQEIRQNLLKLCVSFCSWMLIGQNGYKNIFRYHLKKIYILQPNFSQIF